MAYIIDNTDHDWFVETTEDSKLEGAYLEMKISLNYKKNRGSLCGIFK
jgi:hypothetical protein